MTDQQKADFAKVFAEFDGKITREELKLFQEKYSAFDKNGDGFIDLQELKVAQEKLGKAKTHQEVVDLMKQMAADPDKGITLRDFVVVQLLGKGIKITSMSGEKYKMGEIPALVTDFVKQVENFDVSSIKNFFEEKAKLEKAKLERDAKIEEERKKVKESKGMSFKEKLEREKKEKEELERIKDEEEKKKREHEEKRKAFASRFNTFGQKPLDDDTKKEVKKEIEGDVVNFDKGALKHAETKEKTGLTTAKVLGGVEKFDKGGLKHTETKEKTGLTTAIVLGNVEKFDKHALKPTETKEKTGLTTAKVLGGVTAFDKNKLQHAETHEKTGLTQAKVIGGVTGFDKTKLQHAETHELSIDEKVKLAEEGDKLESQETQEEPQE